MNLPFLATGLCLSLFASGAFAASPELRDVLPRGGQRGTDVAVALTGNNLEDAVEVLYYEPGLSTKSLKVVDAKKVEAVLAVAPGARLGEHQIRLRTESGVSYVHTFWVGPFPSVAEVEPNSEITEAQEVDLNVTVEGFAETEDVDYFKIQAKKGQRISVEVEALRLAGYRITFDPFIAVYKEDGTELALADDTALHLQDTALSILAPEDGAYIIEVRDSAYGGASTYRYRTHIGTYPRPTAVYPAGGKAGSEVDVTFLGDAKGPLKEKVSLPGKAGSDHRAIASHEGQEAPSANVLRVSSFENVLEAEPNNEVAQATATAIALPLAFNGILETEGDTDYFRFTAKKDQKFRFRALSKTINLPVDTTLAILNDKGSQLSYSDDADGSSDSRLDFTVPADGDYFVRVYDMLKRGGADYVYRVEATTFEPSLALTMPEQVRRDNQLLKAMVAHQGNRFAAVVNITRENFSSDIAFDVPGLPEGMTFSAGEVPKNVSSFPIVFHAAKDAPISGKLTQLKARTVNNEDLKLEGIYTQEVDLVRGNPNNTLYYKADNDQIPVAVAAPAPFRVEIEAPKVPVLQDGTLPLKIKTHRDEGFESDITVRMIWNPPGITCTSYIRMNKDQPEAEYVLTANGSAEVRNWDIVVRAEASTPKGTVYVSSDLTEISVAQNYIGGKIQFTSVEQGGEAKIVCKLEEVRPFEGKAKLELLGLPAKAAAEPIEITNDQKEITFAVKTESDTPMGQSKNLYCLFTLPENGQTVSHLLARGGVLRVDPLVEPVAAEKKDETKKDPKVVAAANK